MLSALPTARLVRAVVILALVSCARKAVAPPPDLPAVGRQVSLLRFPKAGGVVQAFQPDSLGAPTWVSLTPVPSLRRVLGADLDERIAWAVDTQGNLIVVDLESRTVRKQLAGVGVGAVGPDGSLYLSDAAHRVKRVLRRSPVDFHDTLPGAPLALFGGVNDQLAVVTEGTPARLVTVNAEQELQTVPLPRGDVAATFWGDLVAVAADTAIVLYETTAGRKDPPSLRPRHHARRVIFSPSGHRLYVAEDDDELDVFDRFTAENVARIKLPAAPRALRIDASGRWMLVRPPANDSIWVVDLATNRMAAQLPGSWDGDLPLVAGAATAVTRIGKDIASFDLRQTLPRRIAVLPGGGEDLWLVTAWMPRDRMLAAVAAAESATVVQDSALVPDSARTSADSIGIFLQVSTSQNPEWAGQLAKQLKEAGFPSRVLKPKGPDDGYRVVVGPYPNRDVAEESGRKLGRPFFILRESPDRP